MANRKAARARGKLSARMVAASAVVFGAGAVHAQQFTRNVGFGDSYVDTGNIVGLLGAPYTSYYPTGRFSGGTNFLDTMSTLLGTTQVNYALGGATTGTTGINGFPNLGFATEVAGFVGSGKTFSSTDILTVSIGGNDARGYYQNGGSVAGAGAAAAVAAKQATAGITALTGVGAKTVVFTAGDVSQLPEAVPFGAQAAAGSAYSQAYNNLMQASLGKLAAGGVRVEYVDNQLVLKSIVANQSQTSIKFLTLCPLTCIGNAALQSQYLFYFDGIHLTSAGFDILGKYVVNRLNAPLTFAAQGQAGLGATTGFAATMLARADVFASQSVVTSSGGSNGPSYLGATGDAGNTTYAPARSGFQAYILAKGAVDSTAASSVNPSYTTDSLGGTVGAENRLGRTAMIGTAFDYTSANSQLNGVSAKSALEAYQFGVYGAWNPSNFFAQGLLSYGTQNSKNSRAAVFAGDITSASTGTSAAAAGKLGYLFDAGALRIGPIAGLTYASSTTKGYTESGDAALTLTVGDQKAEALVGSLGIQMRYPVRAAGQTLMPYVNITAEQDLKGNGRAIQYSATSAPLIVNTWTVDSGSKSVYGRIAGGVSADLNSSLAANINLNQTFGHGGTNGFSAVGGLAYKFFV